MDRTPNFSFTDSVRLRTMSKFLILGSLIPVLHLLTQIKVQGYVKKTFRASSETEEQARYNVNKKYYEDLTMEQYNDDENRLADMIIVGAKHNWGKNPFTGENLQGRWTVTKEDVKIAYNGLCESEGRNHSVGNDIRTIREHRNILADAIVIDCISRLTKSELNEVETLLHSFANELPLSLKEKLNDNPEDSRRAQTPRRDGSNHKGIHM